MTMPIWGLNHRKVYFTYQQHIPEEIREYFVKYT